MSTQKRAPRGVCFFALDRKRSHIYNDIEGGDRKNMTENSRLMLGLRAKGWTDTEIVNFCLWVETGDEQYKPVEEERK